MYTFVSFTVVELFEKVWQTPMVTLAHEIGVSDVAVAKACRKAGSPLAGRGHWAKSQSSDYANLPRSKAISDSKCSTVTNRSSRLALI
ncbi:hypothetical protein [Pseudomonas viridiflava]|uniref:hypothetical protein n=1 Tax=Pseudomonas viridiflava TaxID=33069 RepID=UPI00073120D0|nr:hypothetical protein [Pseudomonas viridiflava]KTC15881.1 hypothetical protein AO390_22205 [Pseudomonas marginalis ICMP 11289]